MTGISEYVVHENRNYILYFRTKKDGNHTVKMEFLSLYWLRAGREYSVQNGYGLEQSLVLGAVEHSENLDHPVDHAGSVYWFYLVVG